MAKTNSFWKQFANEMNGNYIEPQYWHSDKAEIRYKEWNIVFDYYKHHTTSGGNSYTQDCTRIMVQFSSAEDFRFQLHRKNFFSAVAKLFGAQDIEIGYPEFDKAFITKSNNGFKIKALLSDKQIRQKIENIQDINLQIADQRGVWEEKLPDGEYELSFYTDGKVSDTEYLKKLYSLFTKVLDKLSPVNTNNG